MRELGDAAHGELLEVFWEIVDDPTHVVPGEEREGEGGGGGVGLTNERTNERTNETTNEWN